METGISFNYFAIIVAAIVSFILGGIYVTVFRKQWAALNGLTKEQAKQKQKANPRGLIGIFLVNLSMAVGLAYLVVSLNLRSISEVFWLTFWLFIGFIGPLTIAPVLWEGKSIKLWIFGNIINVICVFLMGLILVFWQ
jgi:hypothetical protein